MILNTISLYLTIVWSFYLQISKSSRKSRKSTAEDEAEQEGEETDTSEQLPISEKQHSERRSLSVKFSNQEEGEESEDATEGESVLEDEEEPLHDGYAFRQGNRNT